jgi:hypothetical protein
MTDLLDGVRDHYRATGLTERLKAALRTFGPEEQRLTPQQLATLDQFHTRGLAATIELANRACAESRADDRHINGLAEKSALRLLSRSLSSGG